MNKAKLGECVLAKVNKLSQWLSEMSSEERKNRLKAAKLDAKE